MPRAEMKVLLNGCNAKQVWEIITNLNDVGWRSDLSRIEVVKQGERFSEYTKSEVRTDFTITVFQPNKKYEFTINNDNMTGHWSGSFRQTEQGTEIVCVEEVSVKHPIMKLIAGAYVRRQQKIYFKDLSNALNCTADVLSKK